MESISRVYKTRGIDEGIRYQKELRACWYAYLSGNESTFQVKTTSDRIPCCFGLLIPYIRRGPSPAMLQMINTILSSSRAYSRGRSVDIESIVKPYNGTNPDDLNFKSATSFWKQLGYRPSKRWLPRRLLWNRYHFTSKNGPNGQALAGAFKDLITMPTSLILNIMMFAGDKLSNNIRVILLNLNLFVRKSLNWKYRKIVYFPDKELKTRVIAEGDYFSQTSLRPLHNYLFRVLRKIPQDCTYDQGSFRNNLIGSEVFYSIDLSAATDRFPIFVIEYVLKG